MKQENPVYGGLGTYLSVNLNASRVWELVRCKSLRDWRKVRKWSENGLYQGLYSEILSLA